MRAPPRSGGAPGRTRARASCSPARTRWTSPTRSRQLADAGLRRIDCEGGPGLVGSLLARGLVDEIRLSIAPLAVAGRAARVASGATALSPPAAFEVASLLVDDSTLLVRYVR